MTETIYGLWAVMSQEFYEEDNTPSRTSRRLIAASTNMEELRVASNAHYAREGEIRAHRGTALVINPGKLKSNTWHNNGGGCMASGYVMIEVIPNVEFLRGLYDNSDN